MSERDKMLSGQWYDANYDSAIIEERRIAQDLCFEYNQTAPADVEKRQEIAEKLFDQQLDNVEIVGPIICDYGILTELGHHVFVNSNIYFMDGGRIKVGNHVFIGPNSGFYTAAHPLDYASRNEGLEKASPIVIKDNVWIGAHVAVLPGVTIGEGSVVAAGSVVTCDLPANSLAMGTPAKVVRIIDQDNQIRNQLG
ncbi:sugar O-acetyltransferase [Aerococcaceae bacterium WGS1372]